MLNIFTKKGDQGTTLLADGTRTTKCSEVVELYGSIDELNAFIGWCAEALHGDNYQAAEFSSLLKQLYQIQHQLFALGQQLTVGDKKENAVTEHDVTQLEAAIEDISNKLPNIKSFILPGGGEVASRLHIVRTVCRRAERAAFCVAQKNKKAVIVGTYLNRLSDWFFVAARFAAFVANIEEVTV